MFIWQAPQIDILWSVMVANNLQLQSSRRFPLLKNIYGTWPWMSLCQSPSNVKPSVGTVLTTTSDMCFIIVMWSQWFLFMSVIWWRHSILATRSRGISRKFECKNHTLQNGRVHRGGYLIGALPDINFVEWNWKMIPLQTTEFATMKQYNLYRQYWQLDITCDQSQGSIVLYLYMYHFLGF